MEFIKMRNRITQKIIILNILREAKDPVPSYNLEKVSTKWGWLGTSGLKRCRELEVEGKITKTFKEGYVWYSAKPPVSTDIYSVGGEVVYKRNNYA